MMPLPELIPFHGEWQSYEDMLYQIFCNEVDNGTLRFRGNPIRFKYAPTSKGKSYSFWHLTSEGKNEDERTPDLRRCERLKWISWVIANADTSPQIVWWENKRGQDEHVVLWCQSVEYAVILARRKGYFLVKSAYLVTFNRTQQFAKEHREYWAKS